MTPTAARTYVAKILAAALADNETKASHPEHPLTISLTLGNGSKTVFTEALEALCAHGLEGTELAFWEKAACELNEECADRLVLARRQRIANGIQD
jgi:hypothetical protein